VAAVVGTYINLPFQHFRPRLDATANRPSAENISSTNIDHHDQQPAGPQHQQGRLTCQLSLLPAADEDR